MFWLVLKLLEENAGKNGVKISELSILFLWRLPGSHRIIFDQTSVIYHTAYITTPHTTSHHYTLHSQVFSHFSCHTTHHKQQQGASPSSLRIRNTQWETVAERTFCASSQLGWEHRIVTMTRPLQTTTTPAITTTINTTPWPAFYTPITLLSALQTTTGEDVWYQQQR